MRALSIRQPRVELILRGEKTIEYRGRPTNIRERVYIYASLQPAPENEFAKLNAKPGDFPTGVILGTVEIVDCIYRNGQYEWNLARPKRLARPLKPKNKPQPVWFNPF